MGQVCEIVDQQGHSEWFYYDEEGRQETHIDRNGNVERTLYNRDNHLVYQRAEDKKGRYPVVNRYLYYPDGTLKEAIGGGVTYHYDYTAHGLLQKKSSAKTSLLEYVYDKNRNIVQRTDVAGNHTHYTYNSLNRLEKVTKENGELLASYRYTIAGQMEQLCYGNGVKTNYCYRDDGKPERLVTITPQGEVLLNYEYAYDGNGNCIQKSGQRYQNEYTYDKKNQLKTASYNGRWETYTYDNVGNRIQKETKEGREFYTYNTKNQLTSIKTNIGRTDFHYDTQGNLREQRGIEKKQYFYDALNRLSTVKTNDLLQKNRYDAEQLRHEVEENGVVSRFIFDNGELSAEETKENPICYLYGKERVIASKGKKAETSYHIQDEAGSTLFLLDETHKIQKTYHYDAFGTVLEESGDTLNRLTYTGQQYDTATGQYYLRARFYNPALGRFLQEDVYRGDGLNLYAYCKNHPVGYYDPSGYMGLKCELDTGKTNAGNKSGTSSNSVYCEYDIVPYDNQKYKTPGFEKHHGVLNEWAEHNIPGYTKKNAPTILLKPETHKLTKEIYREWLRKNYGKPVGDLEIEKALTLFHEYNYAGAQEKLLILKESIPDPNIRQQLNFVYLLAKVYEAWDALDFSQAYEMICELNNQLKCDRTII